MLGSLGFYLANRKSLGLMPLAILKTSSNGEERDTIVVKKGRYHSLAELKGKSLYGSSLFEDPAYINRVVFAGQLDPATYFDLKPTSRPLTAVRKLEKDEADAVLLNVVQYESLRRMPLFEKLDVVYTSAPRPALGLMMTDTSRTRAVRDNVLRAVVELCGTPKGQPVCQNLGIAGFEALPSGVLDAIVKTYESGR